MLIPHITRAQVTETKQKPDRNKTVFSIPRFHRTRSPGIFGERTLADPGGNWPEAEPADLAGKAELGYYGLLPF